MPAMSSLNPALTQEELARRDGIRNRIRAVRKDAGMTQEEFSKYTKTNRALIANYESGRNIPSDASLALISEKFGVSKEWILTGQGDKYIHTMDGAMAALNAGHDLSHSSVILLQKFLNLDRSVQTAVLDYFADVVDSLRESGESLGTSAEEPPADPSVDPEIEADVARYKEFLYEKKKAKMQAEQEERARLLREQAETVTEPHEVDTATFFIQTEDRDPDQERNTLPEPSLDLSEH